MKLLNRSALMLIPNQPYLDWINSLPAEVSELERPLTLAELKAEGRVYLVDECEPEQSLTALVERYGQALLDNELDAWDEFAEYRAAEVGVEQLSQWFEIRLLPLAFDAETLPLQVAQL